MATYTRTVNQASTALVAQAARSGRQEVYVDIDLDFGATGNAHAAGDVFNLLQVPAGYSLTLSGVEVLKVDTAGNSGTIQIKLGATAQGSAVAPTSLGFLATVGSLTPTSPTGASQLLSLTVATGAINAVVRLYATINDLRAIPGTPVVIGTATTPAGAISNLSVDPVANYSLTYVL